MRVRAEQMWLTLYHLICKKEFRESYHFHSFRKSTLLRVRKYLNEVMLDQLPVLADVQRFMDEIAIVDMPAPTSFGSSLMMQQVTHTETFTTDHAHVCGVSCA